MALLSQIQVQVGNIVRKNPDASVIAVRVVNGWKGVAQVRIHDREYRIVRCASELQIREEILNASSANVPLVVVTNLEEPNLGQDLIARFAKRRLHIVDGWVILKEVFLANQIDPALLKRPLLADAVMELLPPEGVSPVPNGILDAETVWGVILRRGMGLSASRPDLQELLQWSMEPANVSRFREFSSELRSAIREWMAQSAGAGAETILDCVESGVGMEAFPVGLAMIAVFSSSDDSSLNAAGARLERYTQGKPIAASVAESWSWAAAKVFDGMESAGADAELLRWTERADQILKEIHADQFAYLSDYSRLGFELRLARFGHALAAALEAAVKTATEDLIEKAAAIRTHRWASRNSSRTDQVEMAVRLLRWSISERDNLAQQASSGFENVVLGYGRDGGFVDWARQALAHGDPIEEVSQAYGKLLERVTQQRETLNRAFAKLFSDWMETACQTGSLTSIEEVLKEVVVPAAQASPVLLLLIDGMSFAVYRELIRDLISNGWSELVRVSDPLQKPVVTAFPSITEVCRRSLLLGKVTSGTGDDERRGFETQRDLAQVSRGGLPPILFQKSDLTEAGSLSPEVRREISSTSRRVVAAIVNAVDDHLLKGEQVAVPWTLSHIPVLSHLLAAAFDAGRMVVMASDHGHVVDRDTVYRPGSAGERYRPDDGTILEDEVRISGPRVVPNGKALIAPWSEKVRYGMKKNGYHGGVSLQECVIPVAVLGWSGWTVKGYNAVPSYQPEWWMPDLAVTGSGTPRPFPSVVLPTIPTAKGQTELPFSGPTPVQNWIESLMQCGVLGRQMKQAGRSAPSPEKLRAFLVAIDERGGTVLRTALAQRLNEPELRIPGFIAAARRILNVDGYPVLTVDEASGSIVINRQLLSIQFELS